MAKKSETETGLTQVLPVSTFTKMQLLKSKRYIERRDLLTVLLNDRKQYSHAEVDVLMDEFMKGKVK